MFSATDLRTGQARWSLPVVGIGTPLPAGDVVYVVSKAGVVICAARGSGLIYWIRDLNPGFATQKKKGWVQDSRLPRQEERRPIWSSPLLANGRLLVAGSTGELVALNAKTGEIQTRVSLGAPVLLGPIAAGDTVYVVTDDAKLIALR